MVLEEIQFSQQNRCGIEMSFQDCTQNRDRVGGLRPLH